MKLKAIAINTFREAVRNKIYYLLIFFGVFFALSAEIISLMTIGDRVKVIKDMGLASINFFSVLIAIFTGINLVYKEIEKKTVYNILSKPISRSVFVLGKFLGLAFTLLISLASMAFIFLTYLAILYTFDVKFLLCFLLLYLELLIITSISLLFSSFSTPILSSIFTICLYLIGHMTWTFNLFKNKLISSGYKVVAYILYYLLPNLEKFNIRNEVVMNQEIYFNQIFDSFLYACFYLGAILVLTMGIFKSREFK